MAGSAPLSPWPGYPEIPIFLDTGNGFQAPKSQRSTATTFDTSKSNSPVSPLETPHCITVTPPKGPPSTTLQIPNSVSPHELASQTQRSPVRHLSPVEYPSVNKQSESWSTRNQKVRTPPFRGPPPVSQFRFGDFPSTHKAGYTPMPNGGITPSGLGIMHGQYHASPPAYGATPHGEKSEHSHNIAQRIEDRLWHYSIHGNIFKKWLLEIISWSISALCMAIILVALVLLQGQKLSKWPLNSTISLNTFVATFSRIASAALLLPVSEALGQLKWSWFFQGTSKKMWDFEIFDNASRGPWGSLQLLLRTKGRKLAALGAAIVLLAIAMDPFFQQVVDTVDRWTLEGVSSIPRVVRYGPKYNKFFVGGQRQSFVDPTLRAVAADFFYSNGTQPLSLGNGTRPEIPITCPTSNCTWPPYESLGFCSTCADVSDLLEFRCMTTRVDWISTLNNTFEDATNPNGTVCGYFLNATSTKPFLMSGYMADGGPRTTKEALLLRTLPMATIPMREPLFRGSVRFKDHRNPVLDAIIVAAADGVDSVYRNATPIALECVISWCVKTFTSSYFEGQYQETVKTEFVNKTAGPFPWVSKKVTLAGNNTATSLSYLENITVNPFGPTRDRSVYGSNETDYGASAEAAVGTILILDDMFPGFITVANASAPPIIRHQLNLKGSPRTQSMEKNPWTASNNITGHVERWATAWTNSIRSSSDGQGVPGEAFVEERYVSIRWEWLSLPLGLLLFSFIFLVATVMRSSNELENVGVWKTSAIATLLYGLPDAMQKKITTSTSGGTPRAQAKELKVKLLPKMGWRISGHVFSPLTPKVKPTPARPGFF
ncbi:hypothetical protein B0J11DRAFT_139418 [Dendryphion nanum]|uniref:DUF3176 domain containing protein n=1 Tax=Dendryphion nanum TaxID=256645 RepID=A0A9P9IBD8_9PLEO|nr:hypothetical protein B0J11DRAFT_139418 [Dendryphion nanum]